MCNCKGCRDGGPVLQEVKQALHEEKEGTHAHLAEIAYVLKLQTGVLQRLLTKFEEAEGTPKNASYVISQALPAQNTLYPGKHLAYDGVLRQMVVSGPGNISITLSDNLSVTGSAIIAVIGCNGQAVPVAIRHKIPLNGKLSISTDASAGTGLLALTAWIEPIMESNPEFFRMRR